ncbi:MAG: HAMP domain-containing sensor histidine kinase [Geminicoccaceae bacterium]
MNAEGSRAPVGRGLSARLLIITVACVLIGEILIYLPSIVHFWQTYLEQRIAAAHLATLAPAASHDGIDIALADELLIHSGTVAITLRDPEPRLMLGELPMVDKVYRLSKASPLDLALNTLETLHYRGQRFIRVIGDAPMLSGTEIDIVLADAHLWSEMVAYSQRILLTSLLLSAVVAALLFVSLQHLIVRPLGQVASRLTAFRQHPEDESLAAPASNRPDEIGILEREMLQMQNDLRQALAGKARLATLGEAVSRISHDLRNSLSSALLVSDRLERSDDPSVRKATPRLVGALERAIRLCDATLDHARNRPRPLQITSVNLRGLVDEVVADIAAPRAGLDLVINIDPAWILAVDRDGMHRVLTNIVRNAVRAMPAGGRLAVTATVSPEGRSGSDSRGNGVTIAVDDTGDGVPARILDQLFKPFASGDIENGTGLGLANSREIVRRHGGEVRLAATGAEGSRFEIHLPARAVRRVAGGDS